MKTLPFEITPDQLVDLLRKYPGKYNSLDIEKMAVDIVKMYFLQLEPEATFPASPEHANLSVEVKGNTEHFNVKGTKYRKMSWAELKVSSAEARKVLEGGMSLMLVSNVRDAKVNIHFLKQVEDFRVEEETRWKVKRFTKYTSKKVGVHTDKIIYLLYEYEDGHKHAKAIPDRNIDIYVKVRTGSSHKSLAEEYGISSARVSEIYRRLTQIFNHRFITNLVSEEVL